MLKSSIEWWGGLDPKIRITIPKYIVDTERHTKAVVIPVKEWDVILGEMRTE